MTRFPLPLAGIAFDLDGVLTDTARAHYRAWKRLADSLAIPFDEASIAGGLSVLLRDPSFGLAFLIQNGEQEAGYLILTFGFDLEFGGRQATLTEVFINEGHRRKGIGSRVFAQLEEICRNLGIGALELQVEEDNLEAQRFYHKLGFRAHSRIPMSKRLSLG